MILAALVVHLHTHRRFIRLDVTSTEQFAPHHACNELKHFACFHYPTVHRGAVDVDARIPLEDRALPIEWERVTILVHHGVDDHSIRDQRLGDDALWHGRNRDALLFALPAGALFALGDAHEVHGSSHVEHFALLIADDSGLFAAAAADALLGRAGDDLLDALQMRWQRLAAWMLALLVLLCALIFRLVRLRERLAFTFSLHFFAADTWLQFKQLQL